MFRGRFSRFVDPSRVPLTLETIVVRASGTEPAPRIRSDLIRAKTFIGLILVLQDPDHQPSLLLFD